MQRASLEAIEHRLRQTMMHVSTLHETVVNTLTVERSAPLDPGVEKLGFYGYLQHQTDTIQLELEAISDLVKESLVIGE